MLSANKLYRLFHLQIVNMRNNFCRILDGEDLKLRKRKEMSLSNVTSFSFVFNSKIPSLVSLLVAKNLLEHAALRGPQARVKSLRSNHFVTTFHPFLTIFDSYFPQSLTIFDVFGPFSWTCWSFFHLFSANLPLFDFSYF